MTRYEKAPFLSSNTQDFIEVGIQEPVGVRVAYVFLSSNTQDFIEVCRSQPWRAGAWPFLSSNTQDFIEVISHRSGRWWYWIPEL